MINLDDGLYNMHRSVGPSCQHTLVSRSQEELEGGKVLTRLTHKSRVRKTAQKQSYTNNNQDR